MSNITYQAHPWPEVVKSYRRMLENYEMPFEPMLSLAEEIATSRYASALYGNTSMWNLQIVQTPEYDPHCEILRISYDPALREFTFEHQETSSPLYKRWTRKSKPDRAFQTFERFLQLKRWFVEERS